MTFATLGGALAAVSGAGSTAGADPAWSPQSTPLVAVGSDALQDLADAYSGVAPTPGITVTAPDTLTYHTFTPLADPASQKQIYSWDAVNPQNQTSDCISAKPGFATIARPNGSGDGVIALSDEIDGASWSKTSASCTPVAITGEIDIARSLGISSPGECTYAGANCLAWVDFAHDALSYAYYGLNLGQAGGPTVANVDHLTTAQLTILYSDTNSTPGFYTDPATNVTYAACLPPISAGVVKTFLKDIGDNGNSNQQGESAAVAANCYGFEQNGANIFQSTSAGILTGSEVAVTPFSVGSYIGQHNKYALDRSTAGVDDGVGFGYINGATSGLLPYDVSGSTLSPNPTYYASSYGIDLYLVVDNSKLNGGLGHYNGAERGIFGYLGTNYSTESTSLQTSSTSGTGAICQAPFETTDLTDFGFVAPATCGAEYTTLADPTTTNIGS